MAARLAFREMVGAARCQTGWQGPSVEQLMAIRKNHLSPSMFTYYKEPLLLDRGHMQYLFDHRGKKFIDLGIVTVHVGHCHPRVSAALEEQQGKLWHAMSPFLTVPKHEYAEKLAAKMPEDLKVCYFVNSGAEANELAIMLARLYTGRFDMISLRGAYHGLTQTLMGATNFSTWKQPLACGFGFAKAAMPDPYRGLMGGRNCRDSTQQTDRPCNCPSGKCTASDYYVNQLEETLNYDVPKEGLAGMILEPVMGVSGIVQYPRNYVKRAFDLIHARGGVCIADEVQTGFGRLGSHYWGFESHGAMPDIVTLGKGIANGFPMGAVVTTAEIASALTDATYFNTFGGNPLACAAAAATIDVIDDERLQQNAARVGTDFLARLQRLKAASPIIGDVRGKGLMVGVELVVDKESKQPLPADRVNAIFEQLKDLGILVGKGGFHGNVLRMKPPMCLTDSDIDWAIAAFETALCDSEVA